MIEGLIILGSAIAILAISVGLGWLIATLIGKVSY